MTLRYSLLTLGLSRISLHPPFPFHEEGVENFIPN
jgi:hypothetical protein